MSNRPSTPPAPVPSHGASLDIEPASPPWDALGGAQMEPSDPFSLLMPAGSTPLREPMPEAPGGTLDALEQLKREAESALRDPDYVGTQARADHAGTWALPAEADPHPLRTLAHEASGADGLMDLLHGAGRIDAVFGPLEPVDRHQFFAIARSPDVLRLFAGDIVPTRRCDVSAALTRREHHLVSMDSAYRPVPAQTSGPDHEA